MTFSIPGATVLVCCAALKTDFSGLSVVVDDLFMELMGFLDERLIDLATRTVEEDTGLGILRKTRVLKKALDEVLSRRPPGTLKDT